MPARQPDNIAKATGYQFYGKAEERQGRSLEDVQADRVAWVQGYGIEAKDARGISAVLEAHQMAAMQNRTGRPPESPLLHFSISFDPKEAAKATPEKQQEIAAQMIERMGLAGHLGFVVSHKDEPHPHMHFVFHRIHPETGKTWQDWTPPREDEQEIRAGKTGKIGSKVRLNHHTRELAREHGLNISRDIGQSQTTEAEYHDARRQGRAPFKTFSPEQRADIRGQTLDAFRDAKGWGELTDRLKAEGLQLGMAGKGSKAALYVYSETHKGKLSDVFGKEKDIRTGKLADRFGKGFSEYARDNGIEAPERAARGFDAAEATQAPERAQQPSGQAHEIAYQVEYEKRTEALQQAIRDRDDYRQQVEQHRSAEQAATEAQTTVAKLTGHLQQVDREAEQFRAEVYKAIEEAYADPAAARKAWEEYEAERQRAGDLAARAFAPERLGAIRGAVRAMFADSQRKKARAAIERMKKARARFVKAREQAEVARVRIPPAEQSAKQARAHLDDWTLKTGDQQEQQKRLAELNANVSEKAAALADLAKNRQIEDRQQDRDDGGRERDRGMDWED